MKILCTSDLHQQYKAETLEWVDADVLVIAGDITGSGKLSQLKDFNEWLGTLSYPNTIVVAGNHDWCFQRFPEESRRVLTNAIYLEDESVTIDGIKFYGSPWQPEFCNWAFNLPRGEELAKKWAKIPNDTNVLVTHGPPSCILDYIPVDYYDQEAVRHVGCSDLLDRIEELEVLGNLKANIFGHIHYAYGKEKYCTDGVQFVNAACCTEEYKPINQPILIEI